MAVSTSSSETPKESHLTLGFIAAAMRIGSVVAQIAYFVYWWSVHRTTVGCASLPVPLFFAGLFGSVIGGTIAIGIVFRNRATPKLGRTEDAKTPVDDTTDGNP